MDEGRHQRRRKAKKQQVPTDERCIFGQCITKGVGVLRVCSAHQCKHCFRVALKDFTTGHNHPMAIWGTVHLVDPAHVGQLRMLYNIKPIGEELLCPNRNIIACQAGAMGRVQTKKCLRNFPLGLFTSNVCPECVVVNQCVGSRFNPYGESEGDVTMQCWKWFDMRDTERALRHLCNDNSCNVAIPCARSAAGCGEMLYKTSLHLVDPVPDLCGVCDTTHHMCQECGVIAVRGDPHGILFSRYLYPAYAEEHCPTCIHCFGADDNTAPHRRIALTLAWWDYREQFARKIHAVSAALRWPIERARYLLIHWVSFTDTERAMLLCDVPWRETSGDAGGRMLDGVMRRQARDSTGQLMYLLVTVLPRDVFFIVFRHLLGP